MSTQEYYIRGENDTDARGPFTQDQLSSLVEAQQVDTATLYYDASLEQWVPITSNEALMAFLFPTKQKLKVRPKEEVELLNRSDSQADPIRVEDMLAAAEGRTHETRGRIDPKIVAERVSAAGRYCLILALLLSVFAMFFSGNNLDTVFSLDWVGIFTDPHIFLGAVDLFFVIVLLLGATDFYPVVRFRSMFGIGLLCFMFFLKGEYEPMYAVGAGGLGMYLLTISTAWSVVVPSALLAVGGMAALGYLRVLVP